MVDVFSSGDMLKTAFFMVGRGEDWVNAASNAKLMSCLTPLGTGGVTISGIGDEVADITGATSITIGGVWITGLGVSTSA